MKKTKLTRTVSLALSLQMLIGAAAFAAVLLAPSDAHAYCYTRRVCYYRYGRRYCHIRRTCRGGYYRRRCYTRRRCYRRYYCHYRYGRRYCYWRSYCRPYRRCY